MRIPRLVVSTLLVTVPVLVAAACSLSGQEKRVYDAPIAAGTQDPDTWALPAASHPKMNDPLAPGTAVATPPPTATVEPRAELDAGTEDAAIASAKPTATAAPKAPVAAGVECDGKAKPCPMQLFMRGTMAGASTPEALTAAFNRCAGLSPNGGWSWRAISQKGAELAKGGDTAGAKKQCAACHGQYKESYKTTYRGRKI